MALTEEGIVFVPDLLSRWVRLPSGVQAHYMTSGEDGPAVVMIHGGVIGSSGMAGFRFMAPFLGSHGFRVYCPDLPAFGLTRGNIEFYPPGFSGIIDFVHDFTSALCLDRFHLGGNSMGCGAAIRYMVAHPERVQSLAVIAGGIGDLLHTQEMEAADPRPKSEIPRMTDSFDGTNDWMRKMMGMLVLNEAAMDEDLIEMRTRAANAHREAYTRLVGATMAEHRGDMDENTAARLRTKGRLEQMTIPAIYVWGRQDVVNAVEVGYLQEDVLPNFQFFYPDNTGHQAQTDSPELINQLFLESFRDGRVSLETAKAAGVSDRRPVNPALVETGVVPVAP